MFFNSLLLLWIFFVYWNYSGYVHQLWGYVQGSFPLDFLLNYMIKHVVFFIWEITWCVIDQSTGQLILTMVSLPSQSSPVASLWNTIIRGLKNKYTWCVAKCGVSYSSSIYGIVLGVWCGHVACWPMITMAHFVIASSCSATTGVPSWRCLQQQHFQCQPLGR